MKRLEDLAAADPTIAYAATVRHADGRFGFVRGRRNVPGFLSEDVGVDANGTVQDLSDIEQSFAEEHIAQWGKIGRQTAEKVNTMRPNDARTFLVWYEKGVLRDVELRNVVHGLDSSAIIHQRPNVIIIRVTKQTLMDRLARANFVRKIVDAEPAQGVAQFVSYGNGIPQSDWIPSSALTTGSDGMFFNAGLFGTDVPVGQVELAGNDPKLPAGTGCSLYDGHEAFPKPKLRT